MARPRQSCIVLLNIYEFFARRALTISNEAPSRHSVLKILMSRNAKLINARLCSALFSTDIYIYIYIRLTGKSRDFVTLSLYAKNRRARPYQLRGKMSHFFRPWQTRDFRHPLGRYFPPFFPFPPSLSLAGFVLAFVERTRKEARARAQQVE